MSKAWDIIINQIGNFKIRRGITSFVNPYSMLIVKDKPKLATDIDFWHVDGISLINLFKGYLKINISRYSFDDTSVAPLVFSFAKQHSLKIGIIGTKPEIIQKAVDVIIAKYNVDILFFRDGYFVNDEMEIAQNEIIDRGIDIVVCGMGTPYQEDFLIGLKKLGWNGYGYTCGGYLHQIASRENYYPPLIDKMNLRWVFRIFDEPKLLSRYFIKYPEFLFKFIKYRTAKTHINNDI